MRQVVSRIAVIAENRGAEAIEVRLGIRNEVDGVASWVLHAACSMQTAAVGQVNDPAIGDGRDHVRLTIAFVNEDQVSTKSCFDAATIVQRRGARRSFRNISPGAAKRRDVFGCKTEGGEQG